MGILDVVGLVEHAGKDGAGGHPRGDGGGNPGKKQRQSKHIAGVIAQERDKEILGLLQLGYLRPHREESSGGKQDHGAVDGPAHHHGEERIEELVLELPLDHLLVREVPLTALDDFGVEKKVVRHYHSTEHAHDDYHGTLRERGSNPRPCCSTPVDVYQRELVDERQPDD